MPCATPPRIIGLSVASIILLSLPAFSLAKTQERLHLRVTSKPKFTDYSSDEKHTDTFLVFEGASLDEWTTSLEILDYGKTGSFKGPDQDHANLVRLRGDHCKSVQDSVLAQDDRSLLYELSSRDCSASDPQHQVSKILYGRDNVFFLIFTHKTGAFPDSTCDAWIPVLKDASIERVK